MAPVQNLTTTVMNWRHRSAKELNWRLLKEKEPKSKPRNASVQNRKLWNVPSRKPRKEPNRKPLLK